MLSIPLRLAIIGLGLIVILTATLIFNICG
jgi:hypothetical protein